MKAIPFFEQSFFSSSVYNNFVGEVITKYTFFSVHIKRDKNVPFRTTVAGHHTSLIVSGLLEQCNSRESSACVKK